MNKRERRPVPPFLFSGISERLEASHSGLVHRLARMYFLYILQSLKSKQFYIGSSSDVQKRLQAHNRGSNKSTKPYRPWTVVYIEELRDKSSAEKREWFLKHPAGYLEKKRIVEQYGRKGGVA